MASGKNNDRFGLSGILGAAPFDRERASVQALESIIENASRSQLADMRHSYSEMRSIANKRLTRLGKSEFRESAAYLQHQAGFPKLAEIPKADLAKAFHDVQKFLSAKTTTVSGQRERRDKIIKSWRAQGLDINKKNFNTVMDIMHRLRGMKQVYGSDTAVEAANAALSRNFNLSDHLDKMTDEQLASLLENPEDTIDAMTDMSDAPETEDILDLLGW